MKSDLRYRLAGSAGGMMVDALLGTVSFEIDPDREYTALLESGSPVIYVLWHGRLLPLTYLHRREAIVTMASRSDDGEYITRVLERWGYGVVRGSSSKGGGTALKKAILHGRAGRSLAFTPDGPRGPKERLKPGVLIAAQRTGLPVVPITAATKRAWWIQSWDRFLVPKPFARVRVLYGTPRYIPRELSGSEVRDAGESLETTLDRLTRAADEAAGSA